MSRERTPVGNILALARSREDQAKDVEEDATSYMPTNLDLDKLMPEDPPQVQALSVEREITPGNPSPPVKSKTRQEQATMSETGGSAGSVKRKRISLYLDDDVLTKIFRVSLERHEQLSSATHRLILEALKARGL